MNMLENIRAQRAAITVRQDELIELVEERGDDMTTEEFDELRGLNKQDAEMASREAELVDIANRKADLAEAAKEVHPEERRTPVITVRADEPIYRKDGEVSFFRDAYEVLRGGMSDAAERLYRHGKQQGEDRAVTSGGFGGMVVPQFLTDEFAEVLHAGRVTANLCRNLPLPPEGMSLTIPRGTTGTLVSAQSDQNTALTSQDFAVTNLVVNVNTYGGLQDLSRQAIERGTNVDTIIYADLAAEYSQVLDAAIINGAGTNGTHTGILTTTTVNSTTTGTATAAAILTKIAKGISDVNSNRFLPADVIIMHPRRWGMLTAAVDSNGRPLVVPMNGTGSMNAFGSGQAAAYGYVGVVQGLPVYTDANIPTTLSSSTITGATEDAIIIARRADLMLWEEGVAPRSFRFEEVLGNQLSVRAVVAGYSAFTAYRQPKGVSVISGSGFAAPTF